MLSRHTAVALVLGVLAVGVRGLAAEPPAAPERAIRYRLDWSTRGTTSTADGGFDVTTDRGHRVHVARGYLTSFSMELVECPQDTSPLAWLLAPATAWAWHSADVVNPATVRSAPIESLTAARGLDAGTVRLPAWDFCQLHYLIARATIASPGLPTDVDVVDRSLVVDGTVQVHGAGSPVPLVIRTAAPNAVLRPITPVRLAEHDLLVVVRRDLARMFDGIDFDGASPAVIANRVVDNLAQQTRVKVRVLD